MGIRVGIDLGTTFSAVARIDPATGKPVVIKNAFGSATTPSVLCFEPDGNVLYGEDANMPLRKSHENKEVQKLYKDYLGEPCSHKAHELLHTTYTNRGLYK